jgi:hypothetical protein
MASSQKLVRKPREIYDAIAYAKPGGQVATGTAIVRPWSGRRAGVIDKRSAGIKSPIALDSRRVVEDLDDEGRPDLVPNPAEVPDQTPAATERHNRGIRLKIDRHGFDTGARELAQSGLAVFGRLEVHHLLDTFFVSGLGDRRPV